MDVVRSAMLVLAAAVSLAAPAWGQEAAPDELIRRMTREVLDAIKGDADLQAGDRKKALALAESKVLPYIDFREAARLAVGRAWSQAMPEQQERLVQEFRQMLIRVYSSAISTYEGQTMRVLPLRMAPEATLV